MYFHVFFYIYFSIDYGNGEGGILFMEKRRKHQYCGTVLYCKLKYIFIQCNLSIYTGVF